MDENNNGGPGRGFPPGAVFLAAHDAVVVIDGAGVVRDWNPSAETLLGYAREEAVGREMAELIIPAPLRDAHRSGLRRYLQTVESRIIDRRLELTALQRDGSEVPVELSVTRLPDVDPPLFAGFIRDLRDRSRTQRDSAGSSATAPGCRSACRFWRRRGWCSISRWTTTRRCATWRSSPSRTWRI